MLKVISSLILVAVAVCAQTEDRVRQSIPVQSSNRLSLVAEIGSILVQPGGTQSVEVEVYFKGNPGSRQEFDRMLHDFSLDVTRLGSDVRVEGKFKNGWQPGSFFGVFGGHWCTNSRCLEYTWLRQIEYRVAVPASFSADLRTSGGSIEVGDLKGSVEARTSGGSLKFGRIDGPVTANTSGGSIALTGSGGRAVLHTSGGSIRIVETVGEVEANTSGGSIHIERTTGPVRAHTSGGSVTVREASGPVDAGTSGGGIDVALMSNKGYDLDASTSGGRVSSDFAVPSRGTDDHGRHVRGPVNGGGPLVRLRTSGGGIRIRRVG